MVHLHDPGRVGQQELDLVVLQRPPEPELTRERFLHDPFAGKPGLVRLCPSDSDFEAEGRPFWWAGGMQGGDVTTVLARFPDAPELANTIAHEFTHRFDGTLFPGLPRWAVEGRATYLGSCARPAAADTLDERWVRWGALWEASEEAAPPIPRRDLMPPGHAKPVHASFIDWAADIPTAPATPAPDSPTPAAQGEDFAWAPLQRPLPSAAEPAVPIPTPRRPLANAPATSPWDETAAEPAPAAAAKPAGTPKKQAPRKRDLSDPAFAREVMALLTPQERARIKTKADYEWAIQNYDAVMAVRAQLGPMPKRLVLTPPTLDPLT